MSRSNYPNGFVQGVTIRGVPLIQTHPGEVFWVNNSGVLAKGGVGGSDGNDGSYRRPFATLDKAMTACTANRGDIVFLMPGHAETETVTNAAIAQLDVAGVAVIGLGSGDLRPSFTVNEAGNTFDISGANSIISNIRLVSSVVDVLIGFDVTAANVVIDSVAFEDVLVGTDLFINPIATSTVDNACDGLVVNNCTYYNVETTCEAFIQIRGDLSGLVFTNCKVALGVNDGECFVGVTTATDTCTNMYIADNDLLRLNTTSPLFFEGTANDCTGWIVRNNLRHADVQAALLISTGSPVGMLGNLLSEANDVGGFTMPAIGSDA